MDRECRCDLNSIYGNEGVSERMSVYRQTLHTWNVGVTLRPYMEVFKQEKRTLMAFIDAHTVLYIK